ncbi:MAG: hypothetical protein AB7E81_24590 [Hyphomicrobiaceae bacterium]
MDTGGDDVRILIELDHAEREAKRVAELLAALRKRHDLTRFEFTKLVRVQPAGPTYSHPILTLGTRFAETEDLLLSTYLHEQMHWYLWRLGGPDHDPIAPFFDELVRRYPQAPIKLPDGARSYEQTYLHIVVCWLEVAAATELIGRERAISIAQAPWGYRWIYRTVIQDWDALGSLLEANGILPMRTPDDLDGDERQRKGAQGAPIAANGAQKRTPSARKPIHARKAPRRAQERGGRLNG